MLFRGAVPCEGVVSVCFVLEVTVRTLSLEVTTVCRGNHLFVSVTVRVFPNFGTFPENFDIRKQIFSLKKQ